MRSGTSRSYSAESSTTHPGAHCAVRLAGDPLGTLGRQEGVLVDGDGSQASGVNRWGDYSSMTLDA